MVKSSLREVRQFKLRMKPTYGIRLRNGPLYPLINPTAETGGKEIAIFAAGKVGEHLIFPFGRANLEVNLANEILPSNP